MGFQGRKAEDITRLEVGYLVVLEPAGTDQNGNKLWRCECSNAGKNCTRFCTHTYTALKHRRVKSCGCGRGRGERVKKRSDAFSPEKMAVALRLKQYKQNARHRGLPWLLTDEQASLLFRQNCHYCGHEPTSLQLNGIDRVRNEQGY